MPLHSVKATIFWALLAAALSTATPSSAVEYELIRLDIPEASILIQAGLEGAARETAGMYPGLKNDIEERFGWPIDFRPRIVLLSDRQFFQRNAGSNLFLAYAIPAEQLIVIDYSRTSIRGGRLRSVLKHELAHLVLHANIPRGSLPRWLDEGLAQWASDGIGELLLEASPSLLDKAAISDRTIPLQQLESNFPQERRRLQLAYEISRSFIFYVAREFGEDRLLALLNRLHNGQTVEQAFENTLSAGVAAVEKRWLADLKGPAGWIGYLAAHVYTLLFGAAALMTVFGFIRFIVRKRNYRDDDPDELD